MVEFNRGSWMAVKQKMITSGPVYVQTVGRHIVGKTRIIVYTR